MPTLRDVAELAGVSVATVSHVINRTRRISAGTTDRVERAIKALGYVPNEAGRMLALQRGTSRESIDANSPTTDASDRADRNGLDDDSVVSRSRAPSDLETSRMRRMLLRLVRAAQPISRVEMARRLGVRRGVITALTKPLIE